jgi:demethylmenaquinone methyltransferase/2-methoxy-6-polyprenyl-1,4-benzoquinol methylase
VREMFDGLVERYDVVNDVLSLGFDRWWRRVAARAVADATAPGARVLDLGCGTGRLGALLAGRARVVGVDVSRAMLARARDAAPPFAGLVQGSAFRLPFADGSFGAVTSAFVLRNLEDLGGAFREMARVTAPGGTVVALDITGPSDRRVRRLFDAYFGTVAPALGGLVGRREAYRYLVRSLAQLPSSAELCALLEGAGLMAARARPLTWGTATLFTALVRDGADRKEASR